MLWDSFPIVRTKAKPSQSSTWQRMQDGLLPFRTTGHCKYPFWSCVIFLLDSCRHENPIPEPLLRLVVFSSSMADFHGHRHLQFLFQLLIGWHLWRPSWIWKTIEPIVLETIAYCLSRLLVGYGSFERAFLLSFRQQLWRNIVRIATFAKFANFLGPF